MSLRILAAGAALASLAFAASASAGVVLSDNFDSSVAQGNWAGDSIFRSIPQPGNVTGQPSVDLVGPGFFGNLAFSGNSVDLDGSTGTGFIPAGELQSVASLATGNYTVSFLLAGNLRNAPNQTTVVSIGGQSIDVTPPSNAQPYTAYTLHFTGASGQVAFTDLGPATQQGDLLDNVVVSTAVPEPMTWALMLAGLGGVGGAMRSRRRTAAAAA
ncbi:MAG TPA: PEPxxWA-CTERM sorting domain-containing protein [Caulobacteraceae bacterium]|nr:PEPxxWA-CTERM sorting domain-containing protein [Caulobacteraceae bacterium]